LRFALVLVGRVHVGGVGGEFRGAGIHPFVDGTDAGAVPGAAHFGFGRIEEVCQPPVGESLALEHAQRARVDLREPLVVELHLDIDDLLDLREEPGVDARELVYFLERKPVLERVADVPDALRPRLAEFLFDLLAVGRLLVEPVDADLQAAQGLLERLLEGTADRHHLPHGFHLRRQPVVRLRKFFERKPGDLGHDVIDGRLERGRRRAARNVVPELVEGIANGELRRHLGDREARRLGRERRRPRHARVHFDHEHAPVLRIDRELHVRAAGVDADLAQHRDRRVAHDLVFLIRQRLGRRHGDGIARVHSHRVEVLYRADDDAVVPAIAHDLHLEFLPADHRLLDQQLVRRRRVQPALAYGDELLAVVGDAAAGAAESE